jgi:signal peptidase II
MIEGRIAAFREAITPFWRWGLPLSLAIVVVDQITKAWVLGHQAFNAVACLDRTVRCGKIEISQIFDFTMTWNRGVSFGALQAEGWARWGLFMVTGVIAVVFAAWLLQARRWRTALALALVVGGAIGNMIDRARFGAVVDFLDFSGFYFPWIFNVADAAISVGAVLLLLDQVLASKPKEG